MKLPAAASSQSPGRESSRILQRRIQTRLKISGETGLPSLDTSGFYSMF
jgi:hypothetical protein